jgi:hypothetical protein
MLIVVTPAKAGVRKCLFSLDSGFRRNDKNECFATFYETIKIQLFFIFSNLI